MGAWDVLKNVATLGGHSRIMDAMPAYEAAIAEYTRLRAEVEAAHTRSQQLLGKLGATTRRTMRSFRKLVVGLPQSLLERPSIESAPSVGLARTPDPIAVLESYSSDISVGVGAGAGAAAAAGSWALVGVFGTASTGTAIGTLSGVAATNATMAWFGGGSLAAGGAGMAGGLLTLGGLVAVPLVAFSAWSTHKQADKLLAATEEATAEIAKLRAFHADLTLFAEAAVSRNSFMELAGVELIREAAKIRNALFPSGWKSRAFRWLRARWTGVYYVSDDCKDLASLVALCNSFASQLVESERNWRQIGIRLAAVPSSELIERTDSWIRLNHTTTLRAPLFFDLVAVISLSVAATIYFLSYIRSDKQTTSAKQTVATVSAPQQVQPRFPAETMAASVEAPAGPTAEPPTTSTKSVQAVEADVVSDVLTVPSSQGTSSSSPANDRLLKSEAEPTVSAERAPTQAEAVVLDSLSDTSPSSVKAPTTVWPNSSVGRLLRDFDSVAIASAISSSPIGFRTQDFRLDPRRDVLGSQEPRHLGCGGDAQKRFENGNLVPVRLTFTAKARPDYIAGLKEWAETYADAQNPVANVRIWTESEAQHYAVPNAALAARAYSEAFDQYKGQYRYRIDFSFFSGSAVVYAAKYWTKDSWKLEGACRSSIYFQEDENSPTSFPSDSQITGLEIRSDADGNALPIKIDGAASPLVVIFFMPEELLTSISDVQIVGRWVNR